MDLALGARADAVHVRLELGQVLVTDGSADAEADAARAVRLAQGAALEARALGLSGPLAGADRLLRGCATTTAQQDPLTPREREVAELVAQSLRNREVAERLVLTELTVKSHGRSVLAKLGLRRRTDIVLRWSIGEPDAGVNRRTL